MKKCFGLTMLIVGSIIGAGFASGREVVVFFGNNMSLWIAPICGACFFVLCVMFLMVGSMVKKNNISEVNVVFLGKFHFLADTFLLLNSLVVMAGMLSGMDSLLNMVFPIKPLYSILSGILCAVIVSKGLRGLVKCNSIVVPIIIILLILVCSFNISNTLNPLPFFSYSLPAVILYVSMNMMLACMFFVTISNLNKKTIIISSAMASAILTVLMFLLILAINSGRVQDYPMPMLELAKRFNKTLFYLCIAVIAISIFTTMLTAMSTLNLWVQSFGGGDAWSVSVVLIAGLIVSNLGFENVIGYLYPLIGAIGVVYIIINIVFIIRTQHSKRTLLLAQRMFKKG